VGLDIWLPSIFDYADGDATERLFDNRQELQVAKAGGDPSAILDAIYDTLRATGGYYREGYNRTGLLPALGLDWDDIIAQLLDRTILPVDHAKMLLAELEARSPTPDKARRILECLDVPRKAGAIERLVHGNTDQFEPPPREELEAEIQNLYHHWIERRSGLMSLLRKAIERDEPLRVSA
jgi:hypothetical protein